MASSNIRPGVDIGGTSTDVVLEKAGELFSTKGYITPQHAAEHYKLSAAEAAGVIEQSKRGELT